ncbi:long-chain fatty acid--CoA ligase [Ideonella livida]|uniref:Long-chain fatty acid--CoA ligase n=1 Tax=Ideonella livida TaxID=2707176 RepID=A0A7C9PHI3_9BURK|nr:long-chain fatty acid--CoA ligase [Ideonella livida]NDY91391.1 long-chain fatty acid--CoA ligase [Ideonella livida]
MSLRPDAPHLRHWPQRLPRSLALPETTLWQNLEVTASRYPGKAATLFMGRTLSYAELRASAERLAGWMQAQGVGRGDRVALFLQNSPQFLIAFYAAMRCDAVVVPVNPMNRVEEFGHYITDPETRLVVCGADGAAVVVQANAALPPAQRLRAVLVARYADLLPAQPEPDLDLPPALQAWLYADPALPAECAGTPVVRWQEAMSQAQVPDAPSRAQPDDLALLPYTSGTTGLPKGCMHTHRSLMPNVVGGALWSHGGAETVSLAVVPMFHITGMLYGVLGPVWTGATQVILPRWDRELAGRLISRHGVTHWTCIPTMLIDLLASPRLDVCDLSSLRYLSGGGAAMPQAVAERLRERFGLTFAEGYGLTETAAPSHANPPERAKLQCLGMPLFDVDSRVVDPDTLQEMPLGEVGEIVTEGPMVFQGYWRHPEATQAAFVHIDGKRFFRTGDLGRMDEEGYFFLTDRLKRMINASGFKVWPSEVELLLYRHPAVAEACVIAARDEYRGETVKAVVVLRPEAVGQVSEAELVSWAHGHMAAYKAPRQVQFVEALPKSGSGKVMWRLLQDQERQRGAG